MQSANVLQWNGRARGAYEVYYLKGNTPDMAFWLRYTLTSPLKGEPVAELWGIIFDDSGTVAVKETFPIEGAAWEAAPFFFRVGDALLSDGNATGTLTGPEGTLNWNLSWVPPQEAFRPYPPLLYKLRFPSTKFVSPGLDVAFAGEITVNGKTYHLDPKECRGQQAHLWGTRHAERWAWAHCNLFEGKNAVFEALSAVPRPNWPALTLLYFKQGDVEIPLLGWQDWLRNESCHTLERWTFMGRQGPWRLEGVIDANPERMVGVAYRDPNDDGLVCHNTKVADIQLKLFKQDAGGWKLYDKLRGQGTCAFEVVEREAKLPVRI